MIITDKLSDTTIPQRIVLHCIFAFFVEAKCPFHPMSSFLLIIFSTMLIFVVASFFLHQFNPFDSAHLSLHQDLCVISLVVGNNEKEACYELNGLHVFIVKLREERKNIRQAPKSQSDLMMLC